MNLSTAIDAFSHYSSHEKMDFLIRLGHALTVMARETYEVEGEALTQPSLLRRINEIQHRIMGFLIALRTNDKQRYPDEVLVRIILEHSEDQDLQRQVQEEFSRLMLQMGPAIHKDFTEHG